jgi:transposase
VRLTGGQADDAAQLATVLGAIRVARPGRGRPRTRPERVVADRGYSYPRYRRWFRARKLAHVIPERTDHRRHRAHRPGRPPGFDPVVYARRNIVERCFGRLKQFRALATRYDKTAAAYLGLVLFASLLLWTGL